MWKLFDKILLFIINFVKALRFSVLDYDDKLKVTKTPRQRAIIWTFVSVMSLAGVVILYIILRSIIEPLFNRIFIPNLQP